MILNGKSCRLGVVLLAVSMSLAGCEKQGGEGPAERAGKQVDKAMDQAGQAVDKAKESIKEATKDAVDSTKAAADSAKELVKGPAK